MWIKLVYALQALIRKKDKKCPYCQSINYKVVAKKHGLVDICHCQKCFLYWTNPIFKFPYFYNFFYKLPASHTANSGFREIQRIIDSDFKGSEKNYDLLIRKLRQMVQGKKLLEFGSSWGYFLYQAQKMGFTATGVEINIGNQKIGQELGLTIVPDLDGLIKQDKKFDLIFSSHTLEHIGFDINSIFPKFNQLLVHDGLLFIEVPNLLNKKNQTNFELMGALHPLGFSAEFFIKNLAQKGFVEIKIFNSYAKLIKSYKKGDSCLVIMARKTKNINENFPSR